MQSLLSQFQTPATPCRIAGFFGSGCPTGCPARRITQPTSDWLMLFEPILSIVDAKDPSPPPRALSMPVISAVSDLFNTVSQSCVMLPARGAQDFHNI